MTSCSSYQKLATSLKKIGLVSTPLPRSRIAPQKIVADKTFSSVFSLGGREYADISESIHKHKIFIEDCTAQIIHEGHNQNSEEVQKLRSLLEQMQSPMQRIESFSGRTMKLLQDKERKNVLNWTSTIPYQKHHIEAEKKVLKGTGQWLLSRCELRRWKDSSSSEIIWLHGIPGSGKTTLVYVSRMAIRLTVAPQANSPIGPYC